MKKHIYLYLFLFVPFTAMAQNLAQGLHAHFPFDNNLNDQSANGYDLTTANGSISYQTVQGTDKALWLNGTSGVTSIDPFDNSAFTATAVSVWFKASGTTSDLQIILQGAFMGFGVYIQPNTGRLMVFFDGSSTGSYLSQDPVTDGQWHHVVAQTAGSTTYMYLDGALDGSLNESLSPGNGGQDNKLYLGRSNQNAYPYTGLVNELRIYNRVLTLCEIAELYGRGTDDMIARYPFDGSLADVAGSSYHMTVVQGTPTYSSFINGSANALQLDGNTVLYSEPINNSMFTQSAVSVWFKTSDQSTTNMYKVVVQGAFMGFGLFLESSSSKLIGFVDGSIAGAYVSSMALNDGQWHHIVLQSNGQTTFMYVDGMFDGQLSEPLYTGNGGLDNRIYVGRTNQLTYPFIGSINELRLYDHLISECEIKDLANPALHVGIAETPVGMGSQMPINAYPNPADGVFTVDWGMNESAVGLEIWDAQGKQVLRTQTSGQMHSVDLTGKASGVYLLKLTTSTGTHYCRVLKK